MIGKVIRWILNEFDDNHNYYLDNDDHLFTHLYPVIYLYIEIQRFPCFKVIY